MTTTAQHFSLFPSPFLSLFVCGEGGGGGLIVQSADTHLSLVPVNNHRHTFQINTLLHDPFETRFQLLVERVEVLRGHRADVDLQILEGGPVFFVERDVRAIVKRRQNCIDMREREEGKEGVLPER